MDNTWGKFYAKTFTGSMCGAGFNVFAVWSYAVANAKPPDGIVELNPNLLKTLLGGSEEEINKAIEYLISPDPNSRTQTEEGRRLIRLGQFDYKLVNFEIHRKRTDNEARNAYFREKMREYRERQKEIKKV